MLVGILAELLLSKYAPIQKYNSGILDYFGLLLILTGLALVLSSVKLFHTKKTQLAPHKEPEVLVDTGPFKFTRNPMYLGITLILVGSAAILGAISTLFVPILLVVFTNQIYILMEEKHMAKQFGDAYIEYSQRVRR